MQITLLSNMSPVSASFIIQHITYQIFLLLLALRPCCQPSESEKRHKARFISPQLPFTALFSSLRHLLSFCAFPPRSGADVLRTRNSSRFYWGFFAFFSSRMKTLHEAVQKQLCWRHTKTTLRASERQNHITPVILKQNCLQSVALCHAARLWCKGSEYWLFKLSYIQTLYLMYTASKQHDFRTKSTLSSSVEPVV